MNIEQRPRLNPTVWRTARVLAGRTRIQLLREVLREPGQTVSGLANEMRISRSRASQELRRLQSRGLLKATRRGPFVTYRPIPDPQVPSAAPLLKALKKALRPTSELACNEVRRIAIGFSHPRRIAIARILATGPHHAEALHSKLKFPMAALYEHLCILKTSQQVQHSGVMYRWARLTHPLDQCLFQLVSG